MTFSLHVSGERQLLSQQYVSVSGHTSKSSLCFWCLLFSFQTGTTQRAKNLKFKELYKLPGAPKCFFIISIKALNI